MSKPPEDRTPEDLAAVARFKQLTEQELPGLAVQNHWPIRFDHCFKRVCLDWAFRGVWYDHLPRPAERHLTGEHLRRAVACAEELASGGVELVRERDAASLQWRGKRPKTGTGAS